ncbi:MAG: DUF1704 domain-containing protein [Methanosarcinaceae archaeon]|nr:DUF1704 domain-containing protein [Methanosarcinaceae archaeon]
MGERTIFESITEFDRQAENCLLKYDWKLFEIEKQLNILRYISPLNTEREKAKFMKAQAAGRQYNPTLEYEPLGPEIKGFCRDLEKIRVKMEKCRHSLLAPYCTNKIDKLLYLIELFRIRGQEPAPSDFGEKMTELYGSPPERLVLNARSNLKKYREIEEVETLNSAAIRKGFEKEIRLSGLDWELRPARGGGAKLAVNSLRREIYIDDFARFPENSIRRYLCHEIKTHVFRAENGKIQPFRVFLSGFPAYGETEEGLAVYNEYRSGLLDPATLKKYSARVVAAAGCKEATFSELFEELLPYFPPDKAYTHVQRVKRGLTDTSLPGGYTKDFIYLSGYQKVRAFMENQAFESEALKVLYCGKIGLENFDLARGLLEEGLLKAPRFLPDFEEIKPAPDL